MGVIHDWKLGMGGAVDCGLDGICQNLPHECHQKLASQWTKSLALNIESICIVKPSLYKSQDGIHLHHETIFLYEYHK